MTDRTNQLAVLRRRAERAEAQLAAEAAAHDKTREVYREIMYELVDLRLRHERACAAMQGAFDD